MEDRFAQLLFAGLIVGLLALMVGSWLGGRWLSQSRDEQADRLLDGSAEPASFDVSLDGCKPAGDGTQATVSVTNRSDRPAAFDVKVLFTSGRGFTLDSSRARSDVLQPDHTDTLHITTIATGTGKVETGCELLAVNDARE